MSGNLSSFQKDGQVSTRISENGLPRAHLPALVGTGAAASKIPHESEVSYQVHVDISTSTPGAGASEFFDSAAALRAELCQQLRPKLPGNAHEMAPEDVRRQLADLLEALCRQRGERVDELERQAIIKHVLDEVYEYGPLSGLMRDSEVSDILVNGPFQVFVERHGCLESTSVTFSNADELIQLMRRMAGETGRELDAAHPMIDARLPDGSRMNAILNPPAINGPLLSIRRFGSRPLTAEDLLKEQSLTPEMLEFLAAAVRSRLNIVIAGGAGSGKTTLLNALSRYIRPSERIATIEDTAELELQQPHVVKMEATTDRAGSEAANMRELVKNTLRVRPDRIIIGECRGAEVLEMLQAMNTGHEGSMTTIHANSPREVFSRIELMLSLDGAVIPIWALRKQMANSIHLVVQVARQLGGRRKVVCVSEVTGMEGDTISMHDIFRFESLGLDSEAVLGRFVTTGIRPVCLDRMPATVAAAIAAPGFFERRILMKTQPA
jgi:pilus assembly protein CpaF